MKIGESTRVIRVPNLSKQTTTYLNQHDEGAGTRAVPEAANFLFDKVPELFLSRYINHRVQHANQRNSPHSIIPDIHAYNFPSDRQNVNDSGASQTDEAIFEFKTFEACPTRYYHENVIKTAVERRTDEHMRSTKRVIELSKRLDMEFAPEIVGNGRNGIVGPFEAIQGQFYRKQIIVFCAGAFAEINENGEKLIKRLAKIAAAGNDGLTMSFTDNASAMGGRALLFSGQKVLDQ